MIDFNELDELLLTIHKQFGYDFGEYSKASMLRRINRFMEINSMKNVVD